MGVPTGSVRMSDQPLDSNQYRCAECRGVFNKGRSDEEAMAEAESNGFGGVPAQEMVVVCDDCYNHIVERNSSDPRSYFYGREK